MLLLGFVSPQLAGVPLSIDTVYTGSGTFPSLWGIGGDWNYSRFSPELGQLASVDLNIGVSADITVAPTFTSGGNVLTYVPEYVVDLSVIMPEIGPYGFFELLPISSGTGPTTPVGTAYSFPTFYYSYSHPFTSPEELAGFIGTGTNYMSFGLRGWTPVGDGFSTVDTRLTARLTYNYTPVPDAGSMWALWGLAALVMGAARWITPTP